MKLKSRQSFGKYRIRKLIAQGGFADVYRAYDTIEGIDVAIKIPNPMILAAGGKDDFLREVRLTAGLDHPNILPIKNATYVGNTLVIVYPLGEGTLAERLRTRMTTAVALNFGRQMLEGLAFAHRKRVIHCDVKPENLIVFPGDKLRLGDFGIAKLATRTLEASGSGTVGYLAPEQAMGKPSQRSDVFSAGLVIYRMLSGQLPEWPFDWPAVGYDRLRKRVNPDMVAFLQRAMQLHAQKRFHNCADMLTAFERAARKTQSAQKRRKRKSGKTNGAGEWRSVRMREFRRLYGKALQTRSSCGKCGGPISERMKACPWCGNEPKTFKGETAMPARCRTCKRGMKLDWRFCVTCYSPTQGPRSDRSFSDRRYEASCSNCGGDLMPFSRYCSWCHAKVTKRWTIGESKQRCSNCGWGVLRDYWSVCPWCTKKLSK